MKYIVEVNNKLGAFQLILWDVQSQAELFVKNINRDSVTTGLTAIYHGYVETV